MEVLDSGIDNLVSGANLHSETSSRFVGSLRCKCTGRCPSCSRRPRSSRFRLFASIRQCLCRIVCRRPARGLAGNRTCRNPPCLNICRPCRGLRENPPTEYTEWNHSHLEPTWSLLALIYIHAGLHGRLGPEPFKAFAEKVSWRVPAYSAAANVRRCYAAFVNIWEPKPQ